MTILQSGGKFSNKVVSVLVCSLPFLLPLSSNDSFSVDNQC